MQKPSGLTDREQAIIVGVSALLIALGVVTIPSDLPYHEYIGIAFAFMGAVGLALKEWAGGIATTSQASADAVKGFMNFMTQISTQQQKSAQPVPLIDKAKLAADISSIVLQTLEATGTQTSATAMPATQIDSSPTVQAT